MMFSGMSVEKTSRSRCSGVARGTALAALRSVSTGSGSGGGWRADGGAGRSSGSGGGRAELRALASALGTRGLLALRLLWLGLLRRDALAVQPVLLRLAEEGRQWPLAHARPLTACHFRGPP